MVKIEVLRKRLEQLNRSLEKIKRYQKFSLGEFLEDDIVQDVVEYNLFITVNMIIDIATHIVVDNRMGDPSTLGEAFDILYKEKYISEKESITYKNMVAFRNILSHEYVKIDKEMVYEVMKNHLIDFERFILFIDQNFI